MIDDRTGAPTGRSALQALIAASNQQVLDVATANFVRVASTVLAGSTPEEGAAYETHLTRLFDDILPGWGAWVREVFAAARSARGPAA
jgi:hypothetical protein